MNLPLPSSPHRETQDPAILRRTTEQAKFLSEFAQSVLGPLQKTTLDPFSGQPMDLESLAWGFAAASSRALRNIQTSEMYLADVNTSSEKVIETSAVVSESAEETPATKFATKDPSKSTQDTSEEPMTSHGPVMIPAIDLAAHSLSPSCAVRDTGSEFVLYTLRPVRAGEELTIHYGALSNEELLGDYGFTVANNPFDCVQFDVDEVALNAARGVAGQFNFTAFSGRATGANVGDSDSDGKNWVSNDESVGVDKPSNGLLVSKSTSTASVLREETLQDWQKVWLSSLNLQDLFVEGQRMYFGRVDPHVRAKIDGKYAKHKEDASVSTVRAPEYNPQVDPRLLALLRVLYTTHESDLQGQGLDPTSLQRSGSLLDAPQESEVVRTVLGLLSIATRHLGTDLAYDLRALKECILPEQADNEERGTKSAIRRAVQSNAEAIKTECRAVLRSVLHATRVARASKSFEESQEKLKSMQNSVAETAETPATPASDDSTQRQSLQDIVSLSAKRGRPILAATSGVDSADQTQATTYRTPVLNLLGAMRRHSAHRDEVLMQRANSTTEVLADFKGVQRWGAGLPVHTREAYKYRIHRKKLLRDMIVQFADMYEVSFVVLLLLCKFEYPQYRHFPFDCRLFDV